jgi:hypothetical protein
MRAPWQEVKIVMKHRTLKAIPIARVIGSFILVAGVIALLILPAYGLSTSQQPSTVFVYNGTRDTFNNNAQGYIWQQLGLLDANGRPGTVQGNNIVDGSGNVLGSVIRDAGGTIIGYRNAAGTMEAYEHGVRYTDKDGHTHNGGGIQLDNGQIYDGFGEGTGVGYNGPYTLTARSGVSITVNANGCYTSNDSLPWKA